ncbi:oxalurate catabolism protein HpxZ [Rhizosaccharibacter radicis]|uniref:Oxalurate catabolism protein HpxZ n=1 Tax=Rhizosaccharibacter radicis TaxID=2782605 RepID=A0ABT1VW98_9PROT|nr:oxalurate catabolism protein HpxZ [Acetobacteraceae bacterium KSS12]
MSAPDRPSWPAVNDPDIVREIEALVLRYERALMENDLAVLDELFWESPRTVRFGARETLYGAEAITAYRRQRGGAPPRVVVRIEITTFGDDTGIAHVEFRPQGGDRVGRQTQFWARRPEGWRIASAHVSMQE